MGHFIHFNINKKLSLGFMETHHVIRETVQAIRGYLEYTCNFRVNIIVWVIAKVTTTEPLEDNSPV